MTAGTIDWQEKAAKLYARAQQIRNLSFEAAKSRKEAKQLPANKSAADVLKHGYGSAEEINLLYVAMLRALNVEAHIALLRPHDRGFVVRNVLDSDQLSTTIVGIAFAGKLMKTDWLDPGTRFCPYGMLPWDESGISVLPVQKNGAMFVDPPAPDAKLATREARALMRLSDDGSLSGTLYLRYSGQRALRFRIDALDHDEAGKKKLVEDEVRGFFPQGSEVELVSSGPWDSEDDLNVEVKIKVPGFALRTAGRMMVPTGVLQLRERNDFRQNKREHPIYLGFPYMNIDDIKIELPEGMAAEATPVEQKMENKLGAYKRTVKLEGRTLHVERSLRVDGWYLQAEDYPLLRYFFREVVANDFEYAVVRRGSTAVAAGR